MALANALFGCRIRRVDEQDAAKGTGTKTQSGKEPGATSAPATGPRKPSALAERPRATGGSPASEAEGTGGTDSGASALGGALAGEEPESPQGGKPPLGKPSLDEGWRVLAFAGGVPFPSGFDEKVVQIVGRGAPPAETAVQIAQELEALPGTNAGVGAALRLDGTTMECDAFVMDATGQKGFAGGMRSSSSPLSVALALYRGGGATMRGSAADELAKKLGGGQANLITEAASAAYISDLRFHVGTAAPSDQRGLESLYVDPEKLSAALASASSDERKHPERLPIFVIAESNEGVGLAASSGGIPLSYPGAPTLLDAPHDALAMGKETFVAVFGSERECPSGAQKALSQVQLNGGPLLAAQDLKRTCEGIPYLILSGRTLTTSLSRELLYLRGEGLEENAPAPQGSPASQGFLAPQGSASSRDSLAPQISEVPRVAPAPPGMSAPGTSRGSDPSASGAPKPQKGMSKPEVTQ